MTRAENSQRAGAKGECGHDLHAQISALPAKPGAAGLVAVKIAGRAAAVLTRRQVKDLGLTVGRAWDAELESRVMAAAARTAAVRDGMRRLNRRALSRWQLRGKLVQAGHDGAIVEEVLNHLAKVGAIDDEALGRALVSETLARKPAGARLLRAKLRQRGLAAALMDKLVAEATGGRDAVAGARELVRKRLPGLMRFDERTRRRRLWGLLARRGFDAETIERALEPGPMDGEV